MEKSEPPLDDWWQRYQHYIHSWISAREGEPILITGSDQAGRGKFALWIAQLVFCEAAQQESRGGPRAVPCGACTACKRVAAGTHSDVVRSHPDAKKLSMQDLRLLLKSTHRTSTARFRVVVLQELDRAATPAFHLLLKSLEEPGPSSRYLITARFEGRLPATVRSRCHRLFLFGVTANGASVNSLSEDEWREAYRQKEALHDEQLERVGLTLLALARSGKDLPHVRIALQRLRDYYKYKALQGNERVMREVLLASLAPFLHTRQ
jgi:DNA polymerase III delta prime subunit